MSAKNRDKHNRWRSLTIAFRVSPGENEQINRMVKLSGLSKQDYLTANMLQHQFIVFPNPRVQKALRDYFVRVVDELKRLEDASSISDEYIDVLKFAMQILEGMQK